MSEGQQMNHGPVLQVYGDVIRGRTPLTWLRVALMTSFLGGYAFAAQAQTGTCTVTSIGRTPLSDLGPNVYNGFGGGLYPGGSNFRPPAHESAGLTAASAIRPLNASGQVDELAGRIGLVSIGNSTVNQEFEVFGYLSNIDARRHPKLVAVNGAQDGQSAADWADPNSPAWTGLAQAVAQRGLTNPQVQVAWIKVAVRSDDVGGWQNVPPFPATAGFLRSALRDVVRNLKQKYPNLQIAYLSSRIFAGYAGLSGYPEPIAYDEGFSIKWVIEDQLDGDPMLRFAGSNAPAPFLAWGPYLWADGEGSDGIPGGAPGRSDGLEYSCADFSDGLHLSSSGSHKVADQLLAFFHADTTSAFWYTNPDPPPPPASPFYVQFDGVDDYADVAGTNSLVLADGLIDSPFTFEMWVRPTTMAGKQNLLGKWWSGLDQQYRLSIVSNTLRLDLRDGSAAATVSAITATTQASLAGGWHHVAATYDGRGGPTAANGITLYVDGVAVPLIRMNHAAYVAMEHRAIPLQIGRESPGFRQYSGGLDEFRIWAVARTPAQIQGSRATELTGTEAGLVAYWRFNEGIGALVADDSPSTNTAILYNNPTTAAGGPMAAPTPDVTPPGIENIVESNLADTSIRIAFHTTEVATGWASLTTNQSCPCTDVYSQGAGTEHVVVLTGLEPRRAYTYEIKVLDAHGNFGVSLRRGFTTLAPIPDVTSPAVAITRPSTGSVFGTVLVETQATDNIGVSGVRFTLDGVSLGPEDAVAPYSMSWTTTQVADGPHTLSAEARDAAGNVATASVLVNVSNAAGTTPFYLQFDGIDDYAEVADASSLVTRERADRFAIHVRDVDSPEHANW